MCRYGRPSSSWLTVIFATSFFLTASDVRRVATSFISTAVARFPLCAWTWIQWVNGELDHNHSYSLNFIRGSYFPTLHLLKLNSFVTVFFYLTPYFVGLWPCSSSHPFPLFRSDSNTCTDEYPRILMPENSPSQTNLALTPEPAGWVPILHTYIQSTFKLRRQYSCCQWNSNSNTNSDYFTETQDEPPVPNLCLSLPLAGWRWPVSPEASLDLHPQCSYGQHGGPCWYQHYRGQCFLVHVIVKGELPGLENKINIKVSKILNGHIGPKAYKCQ